MSIPLPQVDEKERRARARARKREYKRQRTYLLEPQRRVPLRRTLPRPIETLSQIIFSSVYVVTIAAFAVTVFLQVYGAPLPRWGGQILFPLSLTLVVLMVLEMWTYEPCLFALSKFDRPAEDIFWRLGTLSVSLRSYLDEIEAVPPTSLPAAEELAEHLIVESNNYYVLDDVRRRVAWRILGHLICVVIGLALLAYALSSLTGGTFLQNAGPHPGIMEHLYFAVGTFFTIGTGPIQATSQLATYGFVTLSALVLIAVTSFVIATLVDSHSEFDRNMREAARNYVVSKGRF